MSLAKLAQNTEKQDEFDKFNDIIEGLNDDSWNGETDLSMATDDLYVKEDKDDETTETTDKSTDETEGRAVIEVSGEEPVEFEFEMPFIAGSDRQSDFLEDLVVEEPKDEIVLENDPWSYGEIKNIPQWAQERINSTPKHSGRDVSGLERAVSYLTKVLSTISKGVRSDINGCLDVSKVEDIRNQIEDGIKRLEERKDRLEMYKKKKKAEAKDAGLIKEAQHAFGVANGVHVTVSLLISRLARVCINSFVSNGRDIEAVYDAQCKEYELTKREQAELLQLLEDSNFPVRRDRGLPPGPVKNYQSGDHFDWGQEFNN